MSRDPEHFPDAEEFNPERWEKKTKAEIDTCNPSEFAFGFGRRQCPGKKLADSILFLVFSNIIATMNITKARDERGKEITPSGTYKSGVTNELKPFKFKIEPRSQRAVELIASNQAGGF